MNWGEWTSTELWLLAYSVIITIVHFTMGRIIYENGVWDGAYCQFLPNVQRIMGKYHNRGSVKDCQRSHAQGWPEDDQPGSGF